MFKVFRKIRRSLLDEGRLRRYLAYAFGEIFLVVIGILIALHINNLNQARLDRTSLMGYLNSIARNVESDVARAIQINTKRWDHLPKQSYVFNNIFPRVVTSKVLGDDFTINDIAFTSQTFLSISQLDYLNSDSSGFESLKASGFLSKLQGTDIEQLLFNYYQLVRDITQQENQYNQTTQQSLIELRSQREELEGFGTFIMTENIHGSNNGTEEFRPQFQTILKNQAFQDIMITPSQLLPHYDNLIIYGQEIIRLVENESLDFDENSSANLAEVHDIHGDIGYPKLTHKGVLAGHHTAGVDSSIGGNFWFYTTVTDAMRLDFPDTDWAAYFYYNGFGSIDQIRVKDYSVYKTLRLELKGEVGGEKILIGMKDESNPTDGSEKKIPLTLSKEWQTYDIPTSSFSPTDLSKLFMPAIIVFEDKPKTIYVRNVEFLR